MDLKTLYTIIAIIAAIIILEFYKRERNRVTANLHTDNLKQLLTITALEYQSGQWNSINKSERKQIKKKIAVLVDGYEKGEIPSPLFQRKMDDLLKKFK
jgi:hypothetical protein